MKRKWVLVSGELYAIMWKSKQYVFIPHVWPGVNQTKQILQKLAVVLWTSVHRHWQIRQFIHRTLGPEQKYGCPPMPTQHTASTTNLDSYWLLRPWDACQALSHQEPDGAQSHLQAGGIHKTAREVGSWIARGQSQRRGTEAVLASSSQLEGMPRRTSALHTQRRMDRIWESKPTAACKWTSTFCHNLHSLDRIFNFVSSWDIRCFLNHVQNETKAVAILLSKLSLHFCRA